MPPHEPSPAPRPHPALGLAAAFLAAAALGALLSAPVEWSVAVVLLIVLGAAIEAAATRLSSRLAISGSEVCFVVAAVVGGTRAGALAGLVACLAGWLADRYRPSALVINLATFVAPIVAAGALLHAIDGDPAGGGATLALAVLAAALVVGLGGALIVLPLMAILDGIPVRENLRSLRSFLPSLAFQTLFVVTTTAAYVDVGVAALAFVVVVGAAFAYMARLVVVARDRTREYANLSWGLLSGLIRTLDARDARAARHCAAVARFARDIAAGAGFGEREQELAHTAGLLHDIGRFALSDRVMDRGTQLQPDDWRAIRRHPELGADLLQDIGVYGPVADIIRAHHERPDGRGYPRGLAAGEIPELAKIVAVAEVYDTLTAPDTYRTPMTSFEALNELRRVAGSQLDASYVEILAGLLAGQGTAYRHADDADFDAELDIQRRLNEAAAP